MKCTFRMFLGMALLLLQTGTKAAFITPYQPALAVPGVNIPSDTLVEKEFVTVPGHYSKKQHRLTFKEKVVLKLVKWRLNKFLSKNGEATDRQKRLGKLSLIFGIAAYAVVLIPVLNILSLPAALTAIILGIISIKGNTNTNGIIGLSLGSLFFFLLALIVVLLIVAFSGW